MNYFTLTKKLCSIILTLVMVFNPAFVSAQTASDYLAKAGENLSLAGITLANEIRDSIITTAESIREETVNLAVKTKDAIVAGAESIRDETAALAQKTKDTALREVELVRRSAVALAALFGSLTGPHSGVNSNSNSISAVSPMVLASAGKGAGVCGLRDSGLHCMLFWVFVV